MNGVSQIEYQFEKSNDNFENIITTCLFKQEPHELNDNFLNSNDNFTNLMTNYEK